MILVESYETGLCCVNFSVISAIILKVSFSVVISFTRTFVILLVTLSTSSWLAIPTACISVMRFIGIVSISTPN